MHLLAQRLSLVMASVISCENSQLSKEAYCKLHLRGCCLLYLFQILHILHNYLFFLLFFVIFAYYIICSHFPTYDVWVVEEEENIAHFFHNKNNTIVFPDIVYFSSKYFNEAAAVRFFLLLLVVLLEETETLLHFSSLCHPSVRPTMHQFGGGDMRS